jgi:tetratricopeptide (TPR) repeat protein
MDTEKQVAALIQEAYRKLKSFGDETGLDSDDPEPEGAEVLKAASQLLNKALKADYENEEIKFALKSMDWWIVHISRIEGIQNPYEKGEFILSMLRKYYSFLRTLSDAGDPKYDTCQYVVRRFVFSSALRCFRDLLGDGVNQHDPGLLLLVGRCYKGVGVYEEAARYIEQAARFRRDDSETLAELADVSAMLGETGKAKALFREAFFINPAGVDLRMMESGMILCLRDKLAKEKKGMGEDALRDWMPVYGKLWGVFSVIRELKPIEAGRLKQSIFAMETECRGNPGRAEGLKPRLINKYFWLIDYYDTKREDQLLRDEVLLKIKVTDPEIYERYIQ